MSTRTPDTLQAAASEADVPASEAPASDAPAPDAPAPDAGSRDAVSPDAVSADAVSAAGADDGTGGGHSADDAESVTGGSSGSASEPRPVPVDFPVYGLHPRIPGPRWVDFFEGGNVGSDAGSGRAEVGQAPWALWLGQRLADTECGLRIGSLPRLRYERAMCPGGGDPHAEVAFSAAFGLVNLTLPDSSVPRPDGLIESLLAHAEQHARRYEKWKRVTWRVDGMSVRARIWEFAGGWTGFTGDLDDSYVAVIGIGVAPEELSLARVTDPTSYGVDFSVPISFADLGRHRATRPEAWLPPPRRDAFDAEQLALLPEDHTNAQ